ncbi:gamma-glutamyl-gamma-aminobutyrate hydrolase family protein [Wenjunlia tyrosinilytica]|uniref:Gamma-glutamyl-gamma-aminobutyrate hydrolase n=1 Tax=Wenjunlia tyrosinilytica TaxID=1544741 RepID=A0A917ZZ88_9ACTN|nr:gamma-glutamyl-gamma-aminobutyrate hydrolase family protein [Wenjunlia tyrosinilytica]GGO99814.1 gamma-glutamyl-gamma-aminobutyrate hydrolase [Wenjunlia tyrosinilytica]
MNALGGPAAPHRPTPGPLWPSPPPPRPRSRPIDLRPALASRPLIGVSSYLDEAAWGPWQQPAALIPQAYIDALTRAGGTPVLLPPQGGGADHVVEALDGLLLSGGPDIDPARYGATAHPRTGAPNTMRDDWEFELVQAALERDLPVLGVCRGMQVLNVSLGGELIQHLPDRVGYDGHQPAPATFAQRAVRIRPRSVLGGILGGAARVSCYHHQAIERLGTGLLPAAWSEDETVEAVELPGHRFVVGVQWHPEADAEDTRLFEAFITHSRKERSDS